MTMKTVFVSLAILLVCILPGEKVFADEQERELEAFSEIALRVSANVYLEQGDKQHVEIVAKESTLEELITEVKDRKLIIRFPRKNYLWKNFDYGKITIYITVPEIEALNVSGSGDIIAEDEINARILDLAVSGSGDIRLSELKSDRVKVTISGSGDIMIKGNGKDTATDFSATVSGSGNLKAIDFPAEDVVVKVSGSGNCAVYAKSNLTIKVVGSGDVTYKGNPLVDKTVVGSGSVRDID